MAKIRTLHVVWIITLLVFIILSQQGTNETTNFYGIADSGEIIINSENAVEIKKIYVLPGQLVDKGQLLLELSRPELTLKINEISHQIEELKAQRFVWKNDLKAQISQLAMNSISISSETRFKIEQLESKNRFNKRLTAELKSITQDNAKETESTIKSPVELELESLRKELELAIKLNHVKTATLEKELKSTDNPVLVQINRMSKELGLLRGEQAKLFIYSQIKGLIGSINFKQGEKVSPFAPIIALNTSSPSYVKGYIHEDVYNRVAVGNQLKVVSLTGKKAIQIQGEVVGVGARIVEFPMRLRKRREFHIWGREVQIKIPPQNTFLLGEKVMVNQGLHEKAFYSRIIENLVFGEKAHAEGAKPQKSQTRATK